MTHPKTSLLPKQKADDFSQTAPVSVQPSQPFLTGPGLARSRHCSLGGTFSPLCIASYGARDFRGKEKQPRLQRTPERGEVTHAVVGAVLGASDRCLLILLVEWLQHDLLILAQTAPDF